MNYTQLIFFVIVCFVAVEASAQAVKASPHRAVEPLRLSEVQWTDGFWKQRLDTCRDENVPAMWEFLPTWNFSLALTQNLLDGVTVLEGNFAFKKAGDWQNQLYREFKRPDATSIPATLVPYYSWSNRGMSEMSVWLPLN